jgi:hypothetical protein
MGQMAQWDNRSNWKNGPNVDLLQQYPMNESFDPFMSIFSTTNQFAKFHLSNPNLVKIIISDFKFWKLFIKITK